MPKYTQFGTFFRAKRNALGLPLREFCRRNGLDAANISRLERGLLPPPRSSEILESYAEALKLDPKTEDWRTLQTLAIQETLPRGFHVRTESRRTVPWVNAADIESWADLISARSDFPRLIRRLIHATSEAALRIEFPAGEGSQRPGWDGVSKTSTATTNVPAGLSCWELGVGADSARKAEADFRIRTKNPLGIHPIEATFIFVTARRWNGKAKWEAEKNKLGLWKEVRVLDADSLEAWLELAPAVDTWFAHLLGKRTERMLDLDDYWKNLIETTEPNLTPSVFLTSRRNADVRRLEQWLGVTLSGSNETDGVAKPAMTPGPISALAIESGSPTDAIDFLGAYVANLDNTNRDVLSSRIVIVDDIASWNVLCDHKHSLTLVAKPSLSLEPEAVAQAVRKGHRVLLASDRFTPGQFETLVLSRPEVYELGTALKEAGFEEETARKHALDCSGSLTVLKRRLSRFPATTEPGWSRSEIANQLAPLVLIGCWEDASSADNAVVSGVVGEAYADIAGLLSRATTLPDPPLFRVRGLCSLTSREDSWVLLARRLRDDQLHTWKALAVQVLTADDSQNGSQRVPRRPNAKRRPYSESLRTGIAETLALLAVFPKELGANRPTDLTDVDRVVQQVLGGNPGWRRWAALGRQLPLLAEAAPDAFLDAIESELRAPQGDILQLFTDSDDPLFSQCLHSGLLWALETLAWHTAYLLRTCLVLAELSERDTGKRWSNRPRNSLVEIFLPWIPHTSARVEERVKVLRKIAEKRPTAGWQLLLNLLPSFHGHSMPTQMPKWRNWALNWRSQVTDADYAQQVVACADRLLEMVDNDSGRWADIIKHIATLPATSRDAALSQLGALDLSAISLDARKTLAEKLREQLQQHRAFPDARWVLPNDVIVALEKALKHIEPEDPTVRDAWLFADHVELPEPRGPNWSWEDEQTRVSSLRQGVVATIFAQDSIAGLLRLASLVKAPWLVGYELEKAGMVADSTAILPSLLVDPNEATVRFAVGYAGRRFEKGEWNWVHGLRTNQWSADQIARLATILPRTKTTWELLEQHSDEAVHIYWDSINLLPLKDTSDLQYAISRLVSQHRPFAAVWTLATALHGQSDLPADLLLTTLEATLEPGADKPAQDIGFSIMELLQNLQGRNPRVDERRLARLEWAFINVLDGDQASATTLHNALATDAGFFVELLRMTFRPRNEPDAPEAEPSDDDRTRAMNAYRLFRSWDRVPGFEEATQTVDGAVLSSWVDKARELSRESGHIEICDVKIGEMLAHAPMESDGSWPNIAVRDTIETINTPSLFDGIVIGRLNQRGVTMRMPTAGGALERSEATKYADFATASQAEWPVTAAILRKLADIYENRARDEDARDEDARAEVRRRGR